MCLYSLSLCFGVSREAIVQAIVANLSDEVLTFAHEIKLVTGWMITCAFLMEKFQGMIPNH
jgi:hypothetical protein